MLPFAFSDNTCEIRFFEGKNAVTVKLSCSDETERKLVECAKAVAEADKLVAASDRAERCAEAVSALIGKDDFSAIMQICDNPDSFRIQQVYFYILAAYREFKTKNLYGSPVR